MKQVMMIFAMLISMYVAQAQQRGERGTAERNPEARAKARVERLDKALELSAQQKDSIYNWVVSQAQTQQKNAEEAGQKRENMRSNMQEIHQQTDRKIVSILDEGQKAKYAEMQKQQKNRRSGDGSRRGSKRGNRG